MPSKTWTVGTDSLAHQGVSVIAELANAHKGDQQNFKMTSVNLLIDTGAHRTGVRNNILLDLGVAVVGHQQANDAGGGGQLRPLYRCWIRFPEFSQVPEDVWTAACYVDIIGTADGLFVEGLLGRDFLAAGELTFNGIVGSVTLSFPD